MRLLIWDAITPIMTSMQWTIRLDLGENIKMMANCTRYTTEKLSQHLQYYELIDVILVCEMWSYSVKRNKDDMLPMKLTLLRWLWWDLFILFNQWMNSIWYIRWVVGYWPQNNIPKRDKWGYSALYYAMSDRAGSVDKCILDLFSMFPWYNCVLRVNETNFIYC